MNIFVKISHPLILLVAALSSFAVIASDDPTQKRADSLSQQAEQVKQQVEQEQLQKARDAAEQRTQREADVLKRQQHGDWENDQIEKAQQQFKQRESREEKYLREAREAANKQRKIPKPF
ncbi:hypothetical protein AB4298_06580 [Shewanella sp. 10N.261.52.F9]|uniref:hypothetical protein n=1 Tax=Shewanella TaxID=22 RepID=UPI00200BBC1D|nr:hypothetical protein [Shewanella marinintestina]MCL1148262.1 hypothetical protein [Shewanella marinintestina]